MKDVPDIWFQLAVIWPFLLSGSGPRWDQNVERHWMLQHDILLTYNY